MDHADRLRANRFITNLCDYARMLSWNVLVDATEHAIVADIYDPNYRDDLTFTVSAVDTGAMGYLIELRVKADETPTVVCPDVHKLRWQYLFCGPSVPSPAIVKYVADFTIPTEED